ncbi:hypothetical protein L9F63_025342 [Diploptera punctata]|uniref:Ionotropic glutamate receptor C-terminal domain-containing protein n=1 Tax=Diploptera punctata TaxID=6984 RepID=A0AAD8E4R3_DIPPU|nr:hypothetical protein L9F63_025342 [Diploptera punctata]
MVVVSLSLKIFNAPKSSGYSEHFLNTCSVFLSVPVNRMPKHQRVRTVFFAWILFSLFFMTVFQAFITSFFTDPGKLHQIDTNEELENSNLNLSFIRFTGTLNCWKLFVANKSEFILFKNRSIMFRYFLHSSNFAVLTSEEVIMYNLRFLGEFNDSVTFHKFSSDVINIHKTLIMDITSPLVPLINKVIRRLVEAGIVDEIVESVVDPSGYWQRSRSSIILLGNFVPLSLFHLFSCFVYLIVGSICSCFVFLGELIAFKIKHHVTPCFIENKL